MKSNGERKTYQWVIGIIVGALLVGAGYYVRQSDAKIEGKLDKDTYYRDMAVYDQRQQERFEAQDKKANLIIELLRQHERSSRTYKQQLGKLDGQIDWLLTQTQKTNVKSYATDDLPLWQSKNKH